MALPLLFVAMALAVLWQIFGGTLLGLYYRVAAGQAHKSGAGERAAILMEKQLEHTPRDEALRLRLSALYWELGNPSRAEYIVQKGIADTGPSEALYTELSRLYVLQDKLQDAVELIGSIRSQTVARTLGDRRPAPPLFDPPQGAYSERVAISFDLPEGCELYVSRNGQVPSVLTDRYTGPFTLPDGQSELRAVLVDETGLASEWAVAYYTMQNIVYPVSFQDAAIEQLLRSAINKPTGDILTEDLWDIETLYSDTPVDAATLDDIAYLPSLRALLLTGSKKGCDISALARAETLRELRLESFGLQSVQLEALKDLTSLESLNLSDNTLALLDALSGLEGLRTLVLSRNSVTDLQALAPLTELRVLDLGQNAVSDISPLGAMARLEKLILCDNNLSVVKGLENMKALHTLDLSGNLLLGEVESVRYLTELEWLSVSHCSLRELPDLKNLQKLKNVFLEHNELASLAGLNAVASLESLNAQNNAVVSLLPLAGKDALVSLNLNNNAVESVEPLAGLAALKRLDIENNRLGSLLSLKSCAALQEIHAFGNSLNDSWDAWEGTNVFVDRS